MAKKQKRSVSKQSTPTSGPSAGTRTPGTIATGPSYTPVSARRIAAVSEFKPDYTSIKTDLKRIGILAGSFFGILVVLSFFLR